MRCGAVVIWLAALAGCSAPESTAPAVIPPMAPVAASSEAPTHSSADHSHAAPHGGIVQTLGDLHVEALMMPGGVMFYLSDADQKALPVDGYSGSAAVKGPSGVSTVELMAMGDHLHAAAVLVQGEPAAAVLTLTHEGKAASASFETQAVGLQSHDHTPLHGGQVSMWGNNHVEYAPKDDTYRFWLTDEHRNAEAGALSGSVKDGDNTLPLTVDAAGMLSAKGEGAGSRPVMVEITTGGETFSLGFNAVGSGG